MSVLQCFPARNSHQTLIKNVTFLASLCSRKSGWRLGVEGHEETRKTKNAENAQKKDRLSICRESNRRVQTRNTHKACVIQPEWSVYFGPEWYLIKCGQTWCRRFLKRPLNRSSNLVFPENKRGRKACKKYQLQRFGNAEPVSASGKISCPVFATIWWFFSKALNIYTSLLPHVSHPS